MILSYLLYSTYQTILVIKIQHFKFFKFQCKIIDNFKKRQIVVYLVTNVFKRMQDIVGKYFMSISRPSFNNYFAYCCILCHFYYPPTPLPITTEIMFQHTIGTHATKLHCSEQHKLLKCKIKSHLLALQMPDLMVFQTCKNLLPALIDQVGQMTRVGMFNCPPSLLDD